MLHFRLLEEALAPTHLFLQMMPAVSCILVQSSQWLSSFYKDLTMETNFHMIPGTRVPQDFPLAPGLKMIGSPNVHQSYKSSSMPLNPVTQGSSSTSGPPYAQDSQETRTHVSPNDPRRQQKRTVFTKEQKLVLKVHFDKGMYLTQKECKELSETLSLKESNIKIWFKNRRAKENRRKARELPGNPGYGSHERTDSPTGHVPLGTYASADSQSQSPCIISSTPHLSSSSNSSDHEPNLSTADQMFEEECFKKSPVRERQQRQKDIELAEKGGHQSHGRYELLEYCVLPDASATSDSRRETQSGVSAPPVLSHLNIAPHLEPIFSMCQRPSLVTPPPQFSSLNNSLDQVSIFCKIDRACEEILKKNKRSREQRQQRKKNRELPQMGGQDSHAKYASPDGTVLMASAFEDSSPQQQLGVHAPPQVSPSIISPDSESMFSMWGSPFHDSFPPPLSPSCFPEPDSTLSINQTNKCLLHETLKCAQAGQFAAAEDRIPGQSANCATSAHPAPAQGPDPVCPPVSSTASTAAAEAGTESETESADPTPVSENDQGYKDNADQLFIENLCKLDALLGHVSPPDLGDDFPLLDLF
ncbi:uncharacterized protein LOC119820495 [Arvicola amphibius]|uniref:uncharacterized protein LOC119820495 n=1 Tax=Arvicola amphibius TaxID=1047088 RepID=UPI0018E376A2|nr:uncharacterized protein LOC119820495 [Arvicola amphibius]